MGDLIHAGHITEFADGFTGTCGQTALEVCLAAAQGHQATTAHMVEITRDMVDKKLCAPNGAATIAALATEARALLGDQIVALEWDYKTDALAGDWVSILRANAGKLPILLQLANGQALVDVETGARDESGLHYHAIAVLDKKDDGYVCADGDNPDVVTRFQIYNLQALASASPCGLLMFQVLHQEPTAIVPAGWSDNGSVLVANGEHIEGAIRQYVLEFAGGWNPQDIPLEGVVTDSPTRIHQTFAFRQVRAELDTASNTWHCFLGNIGADLLLLAAQDRALQTQFADLRSAAAAVQEAAAKLLAAK